MSDVEGERMAQAAARPQGVPAGPVSFGKFRLVRRIATGGMANIYLAVLDGPGGFFKTCAVKCILAEYASLDDFSRMFVNEARVAALLSHPNIVHTFDFGKIDDQYYLAMEWVPGTSLDKLLWQALRSDVRPGPKVAVEIGLRIADALAYAHTLELPDGSSLGLVHRDVSPGNILVTPNGLVKLTDFGIVKSALSEATVAGVVKGKYAYMSPEQITGQAVDHRADLFSLGIVMFELAAGRRLFQRDSVATTVGAIAAGDVPRPTELLPDFPPRLEEILLRALAQRPEDRYASARELQTDLEAFRTEQHWTQGGDELSALVRSLLPEAVSEKTPLPEFSASSLASFPGGPSRTLAHAEPNEFSVDTSMLVIEGGDPSSPGAELKRPPTWPVAVACALAALGTALFWYVVA